MGKYLQNDTEPVKDLDFPKSLLPSLSGNGLNVLAFELSLGLKLSAIGPDINVIQAVDFGFKDFGEVSYLSRFELLVDKQTFHLIVLNVVSNRIQFTLGEVRTLSDSFGLDQRRVRNRFTFKLIPPFLMQITIRLTLTRIKNDSIFLNYN